MFNHKKIKYLFYTVIIFILIFFNLNKGEQNLFTTEDIASFDISSAHIESLSYLADKYNLDFVEVLTIYGLDTDFFKYEKYNTAYLEEKFIKRYNKIKKNYTKNDIKKYYDLINNIITEIKVFPIFQYENKEYSYINSWGFERTYGGKRQHKGTDIMDNKNIDGRIPIVSMTDGKIENIGWNEKGGYRVGIRTDNGNYYYYAHLSYFGNIYKGKKIYAGELLGYMGNTGYSKIQGTKGNFDVHLHIGIEIQNKNVSEIPFWINPYPFLNYIEEKTAS